MIWLCFFFFDHMESDPKGKKKVRDDGEKGGTSSRYKHLKLGQINYILSCSLNDAYLRTKRYSSFLDLNVFNPSEIKWTPPTPPPPPPRPRAHPHPEPPPRCCRPPPPLQSSQALVHAQRALQLLHHPLVEGDLLPEVGLHHVLKVHLPALVEVAHLRLQGEPDRPAALPDAVGLALVHLPLVAHALALLHLGEGP